MLLTSQLIFFLPFLSSLAQFTLAFSESRASLRFHWVISFLSSSLSENRIAMTKAFEKVSTGLITFAARNSEFEGHQIKEGEILALDNGKLSFTERDINKATYKLVKKLAKGDVSYVTLIHGADVPEENAEELQKFIQSKLSDKIEVMLVNGGQPVYYYIISVE